MPLFKVSYTQGSRTHTSEFEAVSWQSAQAFVEAVTTCKVTEISEVVFTNKGVKVLDDFDYFTGLSLVARDSTDSAIHIKLYHIKKTLTESQLHSFIQQYLLIGASVPRGFIASLKS